MSHGYQGLSQVPVTNLVCVKHCCGPDPKNRIRIQMIQWIRFQQGGNGPPKLESILVLRANTLRDWKSIKDR